MGEISLDREREFARRRRVDQRTCGKLVENNFRERTRPAILNCLARGKVSPHQRTVRRIFRTAELYRDLQKYSCLQGDTFPDKLSRYRVSAYWARALPTADQFDRTTFHAANFSSAESTIDISEKLHLEIALPVRQSFCHAE